MERQLHDLNHLFAQLGQASDDAAIAQFLDQHRPLASAVQLHEAVFWSPSQADFLRQAIIDDADWADVVDELNVLLHARP